MPFYGLEILNGESCYARVKRLISVSYHRAMKRILCLPSYFSNHYVCNLLETFTFKHFMNFRASRFYFWLMKCDSPCFKPFKTYFISSSLLKQRLDKCWTFYGVRNFNDNDFDALHARLKFVQGNERITEYTDFIT